MRCSAAAAARLPLASFLTLYRYIIFEALDAHFVKVVLPQLGLCGPEANSAHFLLKTHITDVLVTRNWFSHGQSLSVTQIIRAMTSLGATIAQLGCDIASLNERATGTITACIADVHACTDPSFPVTMSLNSVVCLFFTRSLERLFRAIKVSVFTKDMLSCKWPNRNLDIQLAIDCVWDGRCYLFHGKCNRKSMALLVATSAICRLMRSLGPAFAVDADACDADVMQLLVRMKLCDEEELLDAIFLAHQSMYAFFALVNVCVTSYTGSTAAHTPPLLPKTKWRACGTSSGAPCRSAPRIAAPSSSTTRRCECA